jgi:hypothetical protein
MEDRLMDLQRVLLSGEKLLNWKPFKTGTAGLETRR